MFSIDTPGGALFPLGILYATPRALKVLAKDGDENAVTSNLSTLLNRHATGDWGDLGRQDKEANDDAIRHGGRLLSSYTVKGTKLWIVTEADRSVTTVLLPEEY